MANWFECKVRYDKTQENGGVKKVSEPYLVDALSFTEAEARITEERMPYISGDYSVSAVKRTRITDVFRDDTGDKWYMCKLAFVNIDERTGSEKKTTTLVLVQAKDFRTALDNLVDEMKGAQDYDIVSITETMIMDVYNVKLDKFEKKD